MGGTAVSRVRCAALLAVLGAFSACALPPLPPGSLDPLYPGLSRAEIAPSSSEVVPRWTAIPPAVESSKKTGTDVWAGRYRDSRGEGEITFSLVQREATLWGIWKLRTGGGGPVKGILRPDGRALTFHMENAAPECPGLFQGRGEIRGEVMVGTYHGRDCQGQVSDGVLELRLK